MKTGNGLMLSIATAPHLTPETWLPLNLSIDYYGSLSQWK